MAQQGTPFLIPFGDFGMVAHPNRWRAQAGELVLAENLVVENDLLQKDPATTYYYHQIVESAVGPFPPEWFSLGGTFAASEESYYLTTWFEGFQTAAPVVALRASAVGAPSPWARTVNVAAVAVGQLFALAFSREAGTGGLASVTDAAGNVYTKAAQYHAAPLWQEIWVSLITRPLTLGSAITFTFTASPNDVNLVGVAYTASNLSAVPIGQLSTFISAGTIIQMNDTPATRPHKYPLIGVGVISTRSATASITSLTPWIALDYQNVANHTTWQITQSYLSNGCVAAQIEWTANAPSVVAPTGTASVTKGSRTVTGTGSNFIVARCFPGDAITVGGETQIIDSLISSTQLTTIDPWEHTDTNAAYSRRSGPRLVTAETRMYDPAKQMQLVIYAERPKNGLRGRGGETDNIPLYGPSNGVTRAARFVVGGKEIATEPRKLFFFSGIDPVQVLKGDAETMGPLTTPPADWATTTDPNKQPINGIVHQDALLGFGNWNDPHRVYFSRTQDHTVFTGEDSLQLKISSNIGERLYGCAQYQGVLFFWKYPNGIFYLDDTQTDRLTNWGYRVRSQALGCAPSPHAVLAVDDDVIFCDPAGHFHLLSAVNTLGGTADSDLTRALGLQRWTLQHISMSSLEHLVSVYDPHTKTAWFGVRSIEAATAGRHDNDLVIRFDCARRRDGGTIRVTTSRTWQPNSLCLKRRNYRGRACVLIGEIADSWMTDPDTYGVRTNRDWTTLMDVPVGIPTIATLPEHDCDEANAKLRHLRKAWRSLEVVMQDAAVLPQTLTVDLSVDTQFRQSIPFRLNGSRRMLHALQVGEGYTLTATCRTDGTVLADAPLVGLIVYFQPTGTDMSRKS